MTRLVERVRAFLRSEPAGGLILMAATAVALLVANSPLAVIQTALLDLPMVVKIGKFGVDKPLLLWINDGLMAVFFLHVGLELKREIVEGHLSSVRRAVLPAFAAVGGMAVPAAIYAAFNWHDAEALRGWAIPAATDIAFALGVLSLLGKRVPVALKALLLSVAIFDDLGAIVIIAVFHTADFSIATLVVPAVLVAVLAALNRAGVRSLPAYLVTGVLLWVTILKSGVHATLSGVVVALYIPLKSRTAARAGAGAGPAEAEPPLRRLEHALHPWVAFGILPIFALANAGVPLLGLTMPNALHPVPLGIAAALFFGKQLGVLLPCWLATKLRIAALPDGVNWRQLHGMAILCGIGFTMSLFIASLAFEHGEAAELRLERIGILVGSFVAGLAGYFALRLAAPKPLPASTP
jgi:NhaA family Na+:H+ antiporter